MHEHYDPAQYNGYLFYASDGENAADDRSAAAECLRELASLLNYIGYLETQSGVQRLARTEMMELFAALEARRRRGGQPGGSGAEGRLAGAAPFLRCARRRGGEGLIVGTLAEYAPRIESLAQELGLVHYPVDFELVPENFMMEIAVYGLPVRMPHWSFGVRYIHQLIRRGMGHSRIFEVMFPGDPCHAFLVNSNTLPENVLVTAHVLGHADFAQQQRTLRAVDEDGRRPHSRASGSARSPDRVRGSGVRPGARRGRARRRAGAGSPHRHQPGVAPTPLSGEGREGRRIRRGRCVPQALS